MKPPKVIKRSTLIIVLIVALITIVIVRLSQGDAENNLPSFAIEDADKVSRVFMIDKAGNSIDLKKEENGSWKFNDTFDAWEGRVNFLLNETMAKARVRNPVSAAAKDNVLTRMAISAVKVMVYSEGSGKPHQVYYVGGTTPDLLGTYFMEEGGKMPYVVHIPGFNGYLNTRFSLDRNEWISRTVFQSKADEILEVGVTFPDRTNQSFTIFRTENGLDVEMDKGLSTDLNQGAVRSYLSLFGRLNFEGYDDSRRRDFIDSLKQTTPIAIIKLKSINRGFDQLTIYPKPVSGRTKELVDKDGNQLTTETDRFYAFYNKLDRLIIVQNYTFQKVLIPYEFLLNRE